MVAPELIAYFASFLTIFLDPFFVTFLFFFPFLTFFSLFLILAFF